MAGPGMTGTPTQPPDPSSVHVLVSGKVQGVWFRESTRQEAERMGVAGWVRNRPDGDVEAVFSGAAPAVDHMVAWCHHGPPGAQVAGVVATPTLRPGPARSGFRVLR